jgi:hypothetical protein
MKVLALLALVAYASPVAELDAIKFGIKPGTKLTYTSTANAEFEGMGQTFASKVTMTQTMEAEATVDGWTRIKATTVEHKNETEMPFGEMPDPTGLVVTVLVSPTRAQKDLKVVEYGKMTSDQVAVLTGAAKRDLESGFEGLVFSDIDLAVGATWSLEHSPAGAGMAGMPTTTTGKVKSEYKVLELKDGQAVIECKTNGTYQMNVETPDGAFGLGVTLEELKKFTVRTSDGAVTLIEATSSQAITSDFGDFKSSTSTKTELKQA